jgi:hypothetical protein
MWQEKNKRSDFLDKQNSADSVPIPSLGRLESMVSQGLPTISCLKNFIGNIQIESETGRRTLKDLCARLWLKFPVEFVMRSEESGHLLAEYPMSMKLEKDANGNINLLMRHRAGYNKKCKLPEAILFLLRAKMTETSFPGFMVEGDKHTREIYGEIAYQLKDPYFPGRETPYLGQVYPYPVYNVNKETITHAGIIHRAITIFYELELLAKMYPTPFLGGELYEALLWEILLPTKPKTIEAMLREVTIGVAESKLNYGKKHAFLPQFSDELERLVQIHGATLFLKALKKGGEKKSCLHST